MSRPAEKAERQAALVAVPGLQQPLFYSFSGESGLGVGCEVGIELGARSASGWVVEVLPYPDALARFLEEQAEEAKRSERSDHRPAAQLSFELPAQHTAERSFKPILSHVRVFPESQLPLFEWIAAYYGASLADVIENAIPRRTEEIEERRCKLCAPVEEGRLEELRRRAPVQARIYDMLIAAGGELLCAELAEAGAGAASALSALEKKGLVQVFYAKRGNPFAAGGEYQYAAPPELTPGQALALDGVLQSLEQTKFSSMLLYGVTGSGKTEVYIRAIEHVLKHNGTALIIVPEIALTPQLLDQFQSRLNIPLALLHSEVGAAARWKAWQGLLDGELRVAIGARSAVFAPLSRPSLIIVDEEHESSYKQSDGLRYNARDVAIMRAKLANCPIVLGSATPSFESLLNAKRKRYKLLEMPDRVTTRPLPAIEIVDLRQFRRAEMPSENISPPLYQAVDETLRASGQVVILYNRRGFSSYLQCDSCGEVVSCSNCSVTLTFHKRRNRLVCHYCGLSCEPPQCCRFCRDPKTTRVELGEDATKKQIRAAEAVGHLSHRGGGTERVVEELALLFPKARIARLDRDTVGKKDSYRKILGSIRSGDSDILVGTQMVAKGHDLPGVTLVGIIDSDLGLHLPDFRANEKVFQLITQAAGRAGRGKEQGRVLVQTREPGHPTIVATATGRFMAFARYQLDHRRQLDYPPWARLMRIIVSSPDRREAESGARHVGAVVREMADSLGSNEDGAPLPCAVLGPAPAPHEKLRNRYRWHLLIKTPSVRLVSSLATGLARWKQELRGYKDLRIAVDVDAVDML